MARIDPITAARFQPDAFLTRADECARLADLTRDYVLKQALLSLSETFLQTAAQLCEQDAKPLLHWLRHDRQQ